MFTQGSRHRPWGAYLRQCRRLPNRTPAIAQSHPEGLGGLPKCIPTSPAGDISDDEVLARRRPGAGLRVSQAARRTRVPMMYTSGEWGSRRPFGVSARERCAQRRLGPGRVTRSDMARESRPREAMLDASAHKVTRNAATDEHSLGGPLEASPSRRTAPSWGGRGRRFKSGRPDQFQSGFCEP